MGENSQPQNTSTKAVAEAVKTSLYPNIPHSEPAPKLSYKGRKETGGQEMLLKTN